MQVSSEHVVLLGVSLLDFGNLGKMGLGINFPRELIPIGLAHTKAAKFRQTPEWAQEDWCYIRRSNPGAVRLRKKDCLWAIIGRVVSNWVGDQKAWMTSVSPRHVVWMPDHWLSTLGRLSRPRNL